MNSCCGPCSGSVFLLTSFRSLGHFQYLHLVYTDLFNVSFQASSESYIFSQWWSLCHMFASLSSSKELARSWLSRKIYCLGTATPSQRLTPTTLSASLSLVLSGTVCSDPVGCSWSPSIPFLSSDFSVEPH